MKKSFNIQELFHWESKRYETKPMHHPSSSRAFERHQEQDLKHPGLVDLITTKQNKLPSFIDRYLLLFCTKVLTLEKRGQITTHQTAGSLPVLSWNLLTLFQVFEVTATSGSLILKLLKWVELMVINKIQYLPNTGLQFYTPYLGRESPRGRWEGGE